MPSTSFQILGKSLSCLSLFEQETCQLRTNLSFGERSIIGYTSSSNTPQPTLLRLNNISNLMMTIIYYTIVLHIIHTTYTLCYPVYVLNHVLNGVNLEIMKIFEYCTETMIICFYYVFQVNMLLERKEMKCRTKQGGKAPKEWRYY